MSESDTAMSFQAFAERLSDEFDWTGHLGESALLTIECGLDSMGMYELFLLLEEMGFEVDEDSLFNWSTLGDVYASCVYASKRQ